MQNFSTLLIILFLTTKISISEPKEIEKLKIKMAYNMQINKLTHIYLSFATKVYVFESYD
jgi:hypothetical protein